MSTASAAQRTRNTRGHFLTEVADRRDKRNKRAAKRRRVDPVPAPAPAPVPLPDPVLPLQPVPAPIEDFGPLTKDTITTQMRNAFAHVEHILEERFTARHAFFTKEMEALQLKEDTFRVERVQALAKAQKERVWIEGKLTLIEDWVKDLITRWNALKRSLEDRSHMIQKRLFELKAPRILTMAEQKEKVLMKGTLKETTELHETEENKFIAKHSEFMARKREYVARRQEIEDELNPAAPFEIPGLQNLKNEIARLVVLKECAVLSVAAAEATFNNSLTQHLEQEAERALRGPVQPQENAMDIDSAPVPQQQQHDEEVVESGSLLKKSIEYQVETDD